MKYPFFALPLLLYLAGTSCAAEQKSRPNILFILADDMGWQDTSVAFAKERTKFNDRFHTPALERLAREGMKFTQAYSCAVCSPTRVSFLTGQNEARHGVTQWTYLNGDHPSSDLSHPALSPADWNWNGLQPTRGMAHSVCAPTLPMLLRSAGYRTMHLGKGHLGAAETAGADPKIFGFDVRIGGRDAGGCGSYRGKRNFGAEAHPKGPWRAWDLDHYFGRDIHLTEALTREAKREIRSAVADGQPFFCYFAHYAPHTPIEPDERFAPKYRAAGLDETEAAYASLIEGMDQSVGDLLCLLDELGIADDTLVVFTSDNGGVSHAYRSMDPPHTHNTPLSSGKGAHHEGGIRVPLLVRWPGVAKAASTNETPVIIYDWFPTLLNAGRGEATGEIDGINLTPLLHGESAPAFDRPLVWHFPNFWGPLHGAPVEGPGMGASSTIRRGDWKLIYYHADERFELFNLAEDLGETTNLADREPQRLRELAAALSDILRKRSAPMPVVKGTGVSVPFPDEILPSVSSVVPSTSELVVTGLGKIEGVLSAHEEQQGTAKKWEQVRKVLGADAERVIVKQLGGSLGGNTSVRNESPLIWKDRGYFRRARDLGQVFTAPRDFALDAIVLRTGNAHLAFLPGAANAEVFVQFFEVVGTPVVNDNGTPPGTRATHGFSTNHRCDDFATGVQYKPMRVVRGGRLPNLAAKSDGKLTYLRWAFPGGDEIRFEAGKRYAFMVGFLEPAPERNFTLANRNDAASPGPAMANDPNDGYPGGWGLRREGNGKNPPLMIPGKSPPADPVVLRQLKYESAFPAGDARYAVPPTCEGYPDVDTYRDLEFCIVERTRRKLEQP